MLNKRRQSFFGRDDGGNEGCGGGEEEEREGEEERLLGRLTVFVFFLDCFEYLKFAMCQFFVWR
jgi:hypothetical protein